MLWLQVSCCWLGLRQHLGCILGAGARGGRGHELPDIVLLLLLLLSWHLVLPLVLLLLLLLLLGCLVLSLELLGGVRGNGGGSVAAACAYGCRQQPACPSELLPQHAAACSCRHASQAPAPWQACPLAQPRLLLLLHLLRGLLLRLLCLLQCKLPHHLLILYLLQQRHGVGLLIPPLRLPLQLPLSLPLPLRLRLPCWLLL